MNSTRPTRPARHAALCVSLSILMLAGLVGCDRRTTTTTTTTAPAASAASR